jgi:hypothetical protein
VHIPPRAEVGYDLDEDIKKFHVTDSGIVVISKGTIIKPPPFNVWMPSGRRARKKS